MSHWSNWYSVDVCKKCDKRLSNDQLIYANGTCAHCGHTTRSTVTDYKKKIYRSRRTSPWWMFWQRTFEFEEKKA